MSPEQEEQHSNPSHDNATRRLLKRLYWYYFSIEPKSIMSHLFDRPLVPWGESTVHCDSSSSDKLGFSCSRSILGCGPNRWLHIQTHPLQPNCCKPAYSQARLWWHDHPHLYKDHLQRQPWTLFFLLGKQSYWIYNRDRQLKNVCPWRALFNRFLAKSNWSTMDFLSCLNL